MNKNDYNDKLLDKMTAEQEKYRAWLLTLPPEEILHHVYEYTVREDMVLALEFREFTIAQAKALLKSPTPLADAVKEWHKRDSSRMEEIWDALEGRANHVIKMEKEKSRDEGAR